MSDPVLPKPPPVTSFSSTRWQIEQHDGRAHAEVHSQPDGCVTIRLSYNVSADFALELADALSGAAREASPGLSFANGSAQAAASELAPEPAP